MLRRRFFALSGLLFAIPLTALTNATAIVGQTAPDFSLKDLSGKTVTLADFKGKTLGVWFYGNEYPFLSWMSQLGLPTTGGADGVTVLKQGFNVDPILQKQAACISTMTYNEYYQIIEAGMKPEELVVFKYEDQGVATLEDGLYTLESKLKECESPD